METIGKKLQINPLNKINIKPFENEVNEDEKFTIRIWLQVGNFYFWLKTKKVGNLIEYFFGGVQLTNYLSVVPGPCRKSFRYEKRNGF
jgi:hypothetical protein